MLPTKIGIDYRHFAVMLVAVFKRLFLSVFYDSDLLWVSVLVWIKTKFIFF